MFAFALFDRDEKTLILGRDRIGEKPIYYGKSNQTFFFGSELKSFFSHPDWSPIISKHALNLYMRYAYVPTPHCIYQGINKLEPGKIIIFNTLNFSLSEKKSYWDLFSKLTECVSERHSYSDQEVIDKLDYKIKDSVKKECYLMCQLELVYQEELIQV